MFVDLERPGPFLFSAEIRMSPRSGSEIMSNGAWLPHAALNADPNPASMEFQMIDNVSVSETQQRPTRTVMRRISSRTLRRLKVSSGVAHKKSNRQIARELGCDEGTVRRDRKALSLPAEARKLVLRDLPVAPIFREHQAREAATARQRQEAAEKDSMFLSNRLAKLMEDWLNGFSLIAPNALHVVRVVDRFSWFHTSNGESCVDHPQIKAAIEKAKPTPQQPVELFALMEWLKVWLFRWLVKVEPSRDIRDRALTRVRQALETQHTGW
jgi:DNA-binding CsgD family transcriptional regulator